jgi:iron complex outermembrane recepter protein
MTDQTESGRTKRRVPPASFLLAAVSLHCLPAAGQESDDVTQLQEITVTATRQEESLSKVPISVTAFTEEQIDSQGLKRVDDLVRYTPGLNLNRTAVGGNDISIRGIASSAGAGTTGIYIDDTPIQVRNLGYNAGSTFPALFDLERVEVLRGPQGTLFGAGSEGGTVRFIQTTPSLTKYSAYARGEVADTRSGGVSYEGGFAFGGPIVQDRIGFRFSAYYRRDGGYIDGVTGSMTTNSPSGALYGKSINFTATGTPRPNTNWTDVSGFHAALKFAVSDQLTITPSVSYQKLHINDGYDYFWLAGSDPAVSQFSRPVYAAGNPATDSRLTSLSAPDRDAGGDRFYLPALLVNFSLGPVDLVSNTSYFDRKAYQWTDFTGFYEFLYLLAPQPLPGDKSASEYTNSQGNFTEELRLQSSDPAARLKWVGGVFYSRNSQAAGQSIANNYLGNQPHLGILGDPLSGVTNGPPFGPGTPAEINYLGVPLDSGSVIWDAAFHTVDKQIAAFAQADFKITEQLKLTAGARFSHDSLDLNAVYGGPENNLNYPTYVYARNPASCPGGACTPATGAFTPAYPTSVASKSENSTTPKVGISYQMNDANLFYATAAKGFRPAGASLQVPTGQCGLDLSNIGYLDANGKSRQPTVYDSDSVWSYEVGSKNRVLDGHAVLDMSAYRIRWSNIQTSINLPICAYSFVDNVGHATSQGFDLGLQTEPVRGLNLGGTFGYNKTTFDEDSRTPNGKLLYAKGTGVPGVGAPLTLSVSGQYDFSLMGDRGFYIRGDYSHYSTFRAAGQTSESSSTFQPLYQSQQAYSQLNLRLGAKVIQGADLSFFVNNVANSHPYFGLAPGGPLGGFPSVWTASTLRPRTYGLTLLYHY